MSAIMKRRWLEANNWGKERLFDYLLGTNDALLAALESLVEWKTNGDSDIAHHFGLPVETVSAARAAIAQAEGEEA